MTAVPNHPATATVLWHTEATHPGCEFADYKGHRLKVRHLTNYGAGDSRFQIGMVDGHIVASCNGPMADICDRLFAAVDAMECAMARA